jgi:hypothetical protein
VDLTLYTGGKIMPQVIINVPDNYPSDKLKTKIKKIEESLKEESKLLNKNVTKSKWARLAEEIDSDPDLDDLEFKAAWKQMKKDMKEMREDFFFKHDQ